MDAPFQRHKGQGSTLNSFLPQWWSLTRILLQKVTEVGCERERRCIRVRNSDKVQV